MGAIFTNSYIFGAIFLIFMVISQTEFYLLTEKRGFKPQKIYGIVIGIAIFITTFLYTIGIFNDIYFLLVIPLIISLVISELYRNQEHHFRSLAFTFYGIIYIVVPFSLLNYLTVNPFTENVYSYTFIFSFFILIWINDTGAYIIGTAIGKHKLFERISSKDIVFAWIINSYDWCFSIHIFYIYQYLILYHVF